MTHRILITLIILIGLLLVPGVLAADNIVPRDGTVYVGEADLDLSNCNVHSGDEIAWWDSGTPQGVPTARGRVADARHFTVDTETFHGHTGIWYGLIGKKPAFTVEDPLLQIDLNENGINTKPDSIKRGSLVSFQISTNLAALSKRTGSAGAEVTINLTGPNDTVYHKLSSSHTNEFNLDKVYVYDSPYDTGAVWDTSDEKTFPDGDYTISAVTNVNKINENNPDTGATITEKKTFKLGNNDAKSGKSDTTKVNSSKGKGGNVGTESVKADVTEKTDANDKKSVKETDTPTGEPTQETKKSLKTDTKPKKSVDEGDTPTEEPTKKVTAEPTQETKKSVKSNSTVQKKSTDETDVPTVEPTKKVTTEPTTEGKTNKTVKNTGKGDGNLSSEKTQKPTPDITEAETTIETPEPTPDVTDEPTPLITPHPARTALPHPPSSSSPAATPTKASPIPVGVILISLISGILLIGGRRRK